MLFIKASLTSNIWAACYPLLILPHALTHTGRSSEKSRHLSPCTLQVENEAQADFMSIKGNMHELEKEIQPQPASWPISLLGWKCFFPLRIGQFGNENNVLWPNEILATHQVAYYGNRTIVIYQNLLATHQSFKQVQITVSSSTTKTPGHGSFETRCWNFSSSMLSHSSEICESLICGSQCSWKHVSV